MKKILILSMVVLTMHLHGQGTKYQVGDVVEDFTVTDINGNTYNLYDITSSGKYVYIDFFFASCYPCQITSPYFNEMHDKYGCNQGDLFALSVSIQKYDTDQDIRNYENVYGGPFEHAPAVSGVAAAGGGALGQLYGVHVAPTYCIIAPDNTLVVNSVWPVDGLIELENAFPEGFEPEVLPCSPMSTNDVTVESVSIYPSLSSGDFHVSFKEKSNAMVQIFDLKGVEVYKKNYKLSKDAKVGLDVNSGVYLVKVTNLDSKHIFTQKIYIQN